MVKIAGSSCGGSSYATRILKELKLRQAPIAIHITAGVAQAEVHRKVLKELKLIEDTMTAYCKMNIRVKARIVLERKR